MLKESINVRKFKDFYIKKEKIGQGKFSEVFLATEKATGINYAMKCIQKRMLDQNEREFIRKELSILTALSHNSIVKFKELFDSRKSIIIIMEYIKGGDLLKTINTMKCSEKYIKIVIKQILEGVHYLHKLGIIHRDLKPENILIAENNEEILVKIIDFGLSTYLFPNDGMSSCCGTLGYTAPEVFKGRYNQKADLWSIGVIAYAFLIGKLPFFSYIRDEMIDLACTKELEFTDEKWGSYSEESKDFIKCLLEKNPKLRIDSTEALNHVWIKDD